MHTAREAKWKYLNDYVVQCRIRIRGKSWIRIRIQIISKMRNRMRIRINVESQKPSKLKMDQWRAVEAQRMGGGGTEDGGWRHRGWGVEAQRMGVGDIEDGDWRHRGWSVEGEDGGTEPWRVCRPVVEDLWIRIDSKSIRSVDPRIRFSSRKAKIDPKEKKEKIIFWERAEFSLWGAGGFYRSSEALPGGLRRLTKRFGISGNCNFYMFGHAEFWPTILDWECRRKACWLHFKGLQKRW